ncbi:hypothetical protein LQ564_12760 [Massilia sp. G4R7]|uniref:Uncharacterized protein n=1 Tax=Massilia phyllostachyos TaxID=2898585 RepID=A0ABS8Q630_9BURK|nr:hypothetical protein [Massilia phyllostachyos]MCD2517178.1 hypothetical protein [Massilia phyllostachyos]
MKTTAKIIILFLFALLLLNVFADATDFMTVNIDGEEIGGPLGWLVGLVFAGGGMLIATIVMLFVGLLLAVVFTGVGVIVVGALGFAAGAVLLALAPLMLPLLIPVAIIWYLVARSRKDRVVLEKTPA